MSELTIAAYAADIGITIDEARKQLGARTECRLKDPAWRARDGWPATNAVFPPTLDEYPPNGRDA